MVKITKIKTRINLTIMLLYTKLLNMFKNIEIPDQQNLELIHYDQIQNEEELFSTRIHYGVLVSLLLIINSIPIVIKDLPTAIFIYFMIGIASGIIYKFLYEEKLGFKKIESSKEYFEKFTYEKMSIRFDVLNYGIKDMYFWLVFVTASLGGILYIIIQNQTSATSVIEIVILGNMVVPSIIIYSKLLVKTSITSKDGFNFFLALGYFSIVNKFQNIKEIEKIQYIIKALTKYDLYLRQECKLKLLKQDVILTKIIGEKSDDMNKNITKLKNSLENNELDLLREITDMCKNDKITIIEQKKFSLPYNHSFTLIGIISSAIYYIVTSIPEIIKLIPKSTP